jgi:hypothetical protein
VRGYHGGSYRLAAARIAPARGRATALQPRNLLFAFVYSASFTIRYHPYTITAKISAITAYTMTFFTKQLLCSIIFFNYENVGTESWRWHHQCPRVCDSETRFDKSLRVLLHSLPAERRRALPRGCATPHWVPREHSPGARTMWTTRTISMCHIMVARALSQRATAQRRLGQPAAEAGENCCCLLPGPPKIDLEGSAWEFFVQHVCSTM